MNFEKGNVPAPPKTSSINLAEKISHKRINCVEDIFEYEISSA